MTLNKKQHQSRWGYFFLILTLLLILTCGISMPVWAYETAPRITDREIVESLAEVKQGQRSLNQRIDDLSHSLDKRLEAMSGSVDKRFEVMSTSIDKRFDTIDQRFQSLEDLMLTLFGGTMTVVLALFGYMIWDRRSAQKPVIEKIRKVENRLVELDDHFLEIDDHLELRNPSGPVLNRFLGALRKLAETNQDVASVLRSFSLLSYLQGQKCWLESRKY